MAPKTKPAKTSGKSSARGRQDRSPSASRPQDRSPSAEFYDLSKSLVDANDLAQDEIMTERMRYTSRKIANFYSEMHDHPERPKQFLYHESFSGEERQGIEVTLKNMSKIAKFFERLASVTPGEVVPQKMKQEMNLLPMKSTVKTLNAITDWREYNLQSASRRSGSLSRDRK